MVFYRLVKLVMSYILNHGIKDVKVDKVTFDVGEARGTYKLGVGSVITIEPKKILTPKETRRKRIIIFFIVSLLLMIGLSTIGGWLPQEYAGTGRILILVSEIPAFTYSLVSTRLMTRKK